MRFAVIFDVDGVLVQTDEAHYHSWQVVMNEAGIAFDRVVNTRLLGVSRRASLDIILANAGCTLDEATKTRLANQKNLHFQAFLETLTPADVLPGARELIDSLRQQSIPIAAGSSSRNARRILEKTNLTPRFDVIVDGNDIERSKPDPEVFQKCAQQLGVNPSACVVIEDAEAGIRAARAAGMSVISVRENSTVAPADLAVTSLQSLSVDQIETLARRS